MFRTSDIVLIGVMLSAAAFTYKSKHDTEAMLERISRLESQIEFEKDQIDVLKADWSLLTQPNHLQKLVDIYGDELGLEPLDPKQIIDVNGLATIPFPQPAVAEEMDGMEPDQTITGGVAQ
ncbi:cell division protein FtsL [Nitratireductor basaltis]|uniref:Uncharacterized protein n=1 Tax=Nitratireductor basaltis TaxID=472175 RepID=A0A084U9Q2_9HYPH|nr:hypothetical protein [Nitratireductor basaltis]KFB09688.1 hypothetical protein EL18_00705 [Nitratireductor basaltis]